MSILAKKNEISEKYLGKSGVHGVGMSRELGAIRLHVDAPANESQRLELQSVIADVRKDAAPYDVLTSIDDRATAFPNEE